MSRFKKNKTREVPAISTASLPDIVFILLFFFMIVTEPPEKQTQLEVEKTDLEFKTTMNKNDRQNAYRIYVGFKGQEDAAYVEFPQAKKGNINEELRIVNIDEVINARQAGKGGENNALQQAVKTFAINVSKERGPGSDLADCPIIFTVAGRTKLKSVEEVMRELAKQGFKNIFHRVEEDKS